MSTTVNAQSPNIKVAGQGGESVQIGERKFRGQVGGNIQLGGGKAQVQGRIGAGVTKASTAKSAKEDDNASAGEIASSTSQTVAGANKAAEFGRTATTFSSEARDIRNGVRAGADGTERARGLADALKDTYRTTEGGSGSKVLGAIEKGFAPLGLANNVKGTRQAIGDLKNGKVKEGLRGLVTSGGGSVADGLGLSELGLKGAEKSGNFGAKLVTRSAAKHSDATRTAARAAVEARKAARAADAAGDTAGAAGKAAEAAKLRDAASKSLQAASKSKDIAGKAGSVASKAGKVAKVAGKASGVAGGAIAIAEGGFQVYDGFKEGDKAKAGRGAAKSIAGGLMVAGAATGNPVLAAAGGLTYAGVAIYENRESIGNAAKTGAKFVGKAAKATVENQVKAAKAVGGAVVNGAEKVGEAADAVKDKTVDTAKNTVKSAGKAAKKVLGWLS